MSDVHWRNSMKSARFFALDARAVFPFLLVLIHVRGWTLMLALVCTILFWLAERIGLRFDSALRAVRAWLVAPYRPARPYQLNHRMADLGALDMMAVEKPDKKATPKKTSR
ncbi:MAG TPA: IcmT/TraK family protein [Alphaproteobacteria bacterium]|nr:IcmT/TraK family protein [Alphaproteobacteria bacterium]